MTNSLGHLALEPIRGDKARMLAPAALVLLCFWANCFGQGTLQITFNGQAPGSYTWPVGSYSESGMRFSGPQNEALALVGGSFSGYPDNGTGYLQVPGGSGLRFGFNTFPATLFSLVSFDAAEFSVAFPGPLTLQVVGYKGMGLTVTNSFTLDGIDDGTGPLQDFQTFYLDSSFVSLGRVDILCDHFSIDNIVVGGVPEPSTGALIIMGTLCAVGQLLLNRRLAVHRTTK